MRFRQKKERIKGIKNDKFLNFLITICQPFDITIRISFKTEVEILIQGQEFHISSVNM